MVLREFGKVVMPSAVYPDQCDAPGVDLLELFAMPDRYQPVAGAMNNIYRTGNIPDEPVGAHMIPQYKPDGQYR